MTVLTRNNGNGRSREEPVALRGARQAARFGVVVVALCGGCSGSQESTYPGFSYGTSGAGGSGGSSTTVGTGGGGAGASRDAGTEAKVDSVDAGQPGTDGEGGTVGPLPPSQCDPNNAWAPVLRVDSVSPDNFAKLGGVSGDQLSVAFTSPTGDAYVADRAAVTDSFDAPLMLNGGTALAVDRVALSPTGMAAIAVAADRYSFIGFERASRADAWARTSGLEFTLVRAVLESGAEISNPVIGADKRTFFFIVTTMAKPTLYESHWDVAQRFWGTASSVTGSALESSDPSHVRRPTGASFDGHTLFFYDEAAGVERGAWRAASGSPFVLFVDIGAFAEAAPTVSCDTLYHQRPDATGTRLFLAD
jgi:hypothetical protein